jgi:glycosyltransferase involved in cell wall biosynthesis
MQDRIIQVLDSVEVKASGPSESVPRLCAALAARGADIRLFTIGSTTLEAATWKHRSFAHDYAALPVLGRLRLSRELATALRAEAPRADVIHAHGLWLMANIYPAAAARLTARPLVISPRGMLAREALGVSARKKKLFWGLSQGRATRAAHCLHATSEREYADIRSFGLTAPVAIIPNGIDAPPSAQKPSEGSECRTLLYLGRLHPHKGVNLLLDAWLRIAPRHPHWRLDIAGPLDGDHARVLMARLDQPAMTRVRFLGGLYSQAKWDAYRLAELFVLPTRSENFAMTVAEALAAATPVICTKGAPWSGLETHGCGWWIEHGVEPLASALDRAMSLDRQSLAAMGNAGRAWVKADFDWNKIAEDMQSVYAWLSARGPRPACVIDD